MLMRCSITQRCGDADIWGILPSLDRAAHNMRSDCRRPLGTTASGACLRPTRRCSSAKPRSRAGACQVERLPISKIRRSRDCVRTGIPQSFVPAHEAHVQ